MADIREDDYISSLSGSQMDAALLDMAEHNSEAWAVGERNGFAVGEFDETYENNAKYYAEQAAKVVPTSGVPAIRYDVDQSRILSDTEHETSAYNVFGKPIGVMQTFLNKISEHSYLAKIKKLTGKSVVVNQLLGVPTSNQFTGITKVTENEYRATTTSASANNNDFRWDIAPVVNHIYYQTAKGKGGIVFSINNYSWQHTTLNTVNDTIDSYFYRATIFKITALGGANLIRFNYGATEAGLTVYIKDFMVLDLTTIFGAGNEPTTVDSLKSAWLNKFGYPLPNYIPYNSGSIVDTDIKGFGSTGLNIWDEEWEVGGINFGSGQPEFGSNRIRSKNFCRVLPNVTYFATGLEYIFLYDKNYNFIDYLYRSNTIFTTPENAHYFKILKTGVANYNNNISIVVGDSGSYVPSNPYFRNFPITLRSAGSVADTVEDTGNGYKVTRRVGSVDLGTFTDWLYENGEHRIYSYALGTLVKLSNVDDNNYVVNGIVPNYTVTSRNNLLNGNMTLSVHRNRDTSVINIHNTAYNDLATFKSAINGSYLNYELATPIVEYHSYNLTYPVTENGTEYFDSPIAVPCEIEYGVDVIKDIVSGVVGGDTERDESFGTLLWENASPGSAFVAQTTPIPIAPYKFVIVDFIVTATTTPASTDHIYCIGMIGEYITAETLMFTVALQKREIRIRANDILVSDCKKYATYGSSNNTVTNSQLIPYRVYGIK